MRHGRFAAASVVLLALGAVLLLMQGDVDEPLPSAAPPERVAEQTPLGSGDRGCRERVEGGRLTASPDRGDTIIGPVAFYRAGSAYRTARTAPKEDLAVRGIPGFPMKVVALVDAGSEVRLSVPAEQRSWMKLLYDFSGRPTTEITLRACRTFTSREARRHECGRKPDAACRGKTTQFSGGFAIELDEAPRRGRCAELVVRVAGRRGLLRRPLFRPYPASCARTADLPSDY